MNHLEKAPRLEPISYTDSSGEEQSTTVLMLPAKVKAVPAGDKAIRTNRNGTEWRLIAVELLHPTKGIIERNAQLFEKSYQMFPDNFAKDSNIELMVQTEGEGKGLAKAQLTSIERIDVDSWNTLVSEPVEETT